MRTRTKWQLAGVILLVGLVLMIARHGIVIVDTEETLWPDPRDREAVHLRALSGRLQSYARDHGRLPDSLTVLESPLNRPDEWGTPVRYLRSGPILRLRSAGPDREFGTPDDIEVRDGTTYESKRALYVASQDSARRAP